MSQHDSTLRLNLAASGMLSMLRSLEKQSKELADGMQDIGKESEKSERKINPMLESAKKGLGAAKTAAVELGGELKNAASMALTLGGTLTFGAAAHAAIGLKSQYKDIAFSIRTATGEAHGFQEVQQHVEETADKWKRSNDEVARSYDAIFTKTKDLDFAQKASSEVAKLATASGKDVEMLTKLAGELGDKFDISAGQIGDAMAAVTSTGRLQEMAENMHEIGAAARGMGLTGQEGLEKYIAMLDLAKKSMKDVPTAVASLRGITEPLENLESRKGIEQKLKIKLSTQDGQVRKDALDEILKATGGQREELAQVFSGDTLNLVAEYGKAYQKGFDELSGSFKEKSEAGMEAFNKALKDAMPNTAKTKKDIDEAAKGNLDDPARKLQEAQNKLIEKFGEPKMLAAIDKLAERLPQLAEVLGKLVDFAADHPVLAGAAVLGAKPLMAFGQSMAGDAASGAGKFALEKAKSTVLGKQIAATFATEAAASAKWKLAGQAMGIAAAGVAGFAIGKAIVDAHMAKSRKNADQSYAGQVDTQRAILSGDPEKMKEAQAALRSRIAAHNDEESGISGAYNQFLRGGARLVTGDKNFKGETEKARDLDKAELAKLEAAMSRGAEKGASALDRAADKWSKVADQMKPGGGGTNGLPPKPQS